jgi:hypothetical protein
MLSNEIDAVFRIYAEYHEETQPSAVDKVRIRLMIQG